MALDRVALIVKPGDQLDTPDMQKRAKSHRSGSIVSYVDESTTGVIGVSTGLLTLEEILSTKMKKVFSLIEISRKHLPIIEKAMIALNEEQIEKGGDYTQFRAHAEYFDMLQLASALGDESYKEAWLREDYEVPIINGKSLTGTDIANLLLNSLSRPLDDSIVKDLNAISSGSYTIGPAQDYTTFAAFTSDLADLTGALTGTVEATTTETATAGANVDVNGNTLEVTTNGDSAGDPTASVPIVQINHQGNGHWNGMDLGSGGGSYDLHTMYFKRTDDGSDATRVILYITGNSGAIPMNWYNILLDQNGNNTGEFAFQINDTDPLLNAWNFKIWDGGLYLDAVDAAQVYENFSIYNAPAEGVEGNSQVVNVSNFITMASGTSDYANMGSADTFNKCISDDATGSEAGLQNLNPAFQWLSLDDTESDFLGIVPTEELEAEGASPNIGANNAGIEGNSRPTGDTTTSIGCHQAVLGGGVQVFRRRREGCGPY